MHMPKDFVTRALALGIVTEFVLCMGLIIYFTINEPVHHKALSLTTPTIVHKQTTTIPKITIGSPLRLKIPAITVDAALDYVGLTSQGALGVPSSPANVAWFDAGPRPGEAGNAVIDGHFGYKDNEPAVFDDLHVLRPGDNIYVEDDRGVTTAFTVSAVQTYAEDQADTAVFVTGDHKAHLNLITCDGVWNEAKKSYSSRLVVFADKQ